VRTRFRKVVILLAVLTIATAASMAYGYYTVISAPKEPFVNLYFSMQEVPEPPSYVEIADPHQYILQAIQNLGRSVGVDTTDDFIEQWKAIRDAGAMKYEGKCYQIDGYMWVEQGLEPPNPFLVFGFTGLIVLGFCWLSVAFITLPKFIIHLKRRFKR